MAKGNRKPTGWRDRMPGSTVCPRCLRIVDNSTRRDMARPGMTRGVKWCLTCVLNYLEVPYDRRDPDTADPAVRRLIAGPRPDRVGNG